VWERERGRGREREREGEREVGKYLVMYVPGSLPLPGT
jgi:hypothetical protein